MSTMISLQVLRIIFIGLAELGVQVPPELHLHFSPMQMPSIPDSLLRSFSRQGKLFHLNFLHWQGLLVLALEGAISGLEDEVALETGTRSLDPT